MPGQANLPVVAHIIIKTSQLICFGKHLASFRMVLVFTERYFRAECSHCLSVKLLSEMVIVVLSKS